jgi:hypothetical protein
MRAKQSGPCRVDITRRHTPDCEPRVPPLSAPPVFWLTHLISLSLKQCVSHYLSQLIQIPHAISIRTFFAG